MFDLKLFRKKHKLSQTVLADKLGVGQSFISQIESGKDPMPDALIEKLVDIFDIENISDYQDEPILKEMPMYYGGEDFERKKIPFYDDIGSVGGNSALVANCDVSALPTEYVDAGDWFLEATAAIRHYGDSMVEYPSGCILALKRVEDARLLVWGRNYVVETSEFRVTKQLQDGGDEYVLAYSTNMATYPDGRQIHSPMRIPKDAIRHIDTVLGCVTKEYSSAAMRISK